MYRLFCALLLGATAALAQTPSDPCAVSSSDTADVSLQLSISGGRTSFQQGEVIPLTLSFSSPVKSKYSLTTANYDRSGRQGYIEAYCIEPAGTDPLDDYYNSSISGFFGGGLSSTFNLGDKSWEIGRDLNEWKSLAPGSYRLRVVSHRVSREARPDETTPMGVVGVTVVSNTIELTVTAAAPDWQAQQLASATAILDAPDSKDDEKKSAARGLRFLGSEAATRELARRFALSAGENNSWEFRFGLIGSPHRSLAIESMKAAIADPQLPITADFLYVLALLEIQADPKYALPPFDKNKEAEWRKLQEAKMRAYRGLEDQHMAELATALSAKAGTARALSTETVLQSGHPPAELKASLRQLLLVNWESLPGRKKNEMIAYRWEELGGPELLPALRKIVDTLPPVIRTPDTLERGPALRRIYELAPADGRELMLREMKASHGDIGINVLGLLPDAELPEIETPITARLNDPNGASQYVDYQILARYASKRILPDLKAHYEKHRGAWACEPQSGMLRYFLRADPKFGVAQIADALTLRDQTGCYRMVFEGLGESAESPAIEAIAIGALNDPSVEVARDAATMLKNYGSPKSEAALWARLQKFHEVWKDRASELRYRPGQDTEGMYQRGLEQSLVSALLYAQNWYSGSDKFQRVLELVSPSERTQIEGNARLFAATQFSLNINWWPEGTLSYDVAGVSGRGITRLKAKLAQLPSGAHLSSVVSRQIYTQHQSEFEEIESAARTAGLVLDLQITSRN